MSKHDPSLPAFEMWTDGSVIEGAGGWAYRLLRRVTDKTYRLVASNEGGIEGKTCPLEAEVFAIYEGLRTLTERSDVSIYCDSFEAILWFGGVPTTSKDFLRPHIAKEIRQFLRDKRHVIHVYRIQGHNGVYHNEQCDRAAKQQAKRVLHSRGKTKWQK